MDFSDDINNFSKEQIDIFIDSAKRTSKGTCDMVFCSKCRFNQHNLCYDVTNNYVSMDEYDKSLAKVSADYLKQMKSLSNIYTEDKLFEFILHEFDSVLFSKDGNKFLKLGNIMISDKTVQFIGDKRYYTMDLLIHHFEKYIYLPESTDILSMEELLKNL